MPGFNRDYRFPFKLREIRRRASSFRRLMLIFPYIHPAALHGIIVKNNFDWTVILQVLFASHRVRATRFWDRVYDHRHLEEFLQRRGYQLEYRNGYIARRGDDYHYINPFIEHPDVLEDSVDSESDTDDSQNAIDIVFGQTPQSGLDSPPGVLDESSSDVVRIIFDRNEQDGSLDVQVHNSTALPKQLTVIDRTGTLDVLHNAMKRKRNTQGARQGQKKPRMTKQNQPTTSANEQNSAQNNENESERESSQAVSCKGKATKKTRVKTSKKPNNTDNNI